jgi:hypothetical protein
MSDSNTAVINTLLSQSILTIQNQVQTQSNLQQALAANVQTNTTSIVVNSASINTSSDEINTIKADVEHNTNDIEALTIKEAADFGNLETQIINNKVLLDAQIGKESEDFLNLDERTRHNTEDIVEIKAVNAVQDLSITDLVSKVQTNINDIYAMKNTDINFDSHFIAVNAKIDVIKSDVSANKIVDDEQNALITLLQEKDILLQAQITTNSNDIYSMKNIDINFDSHFNEVNGKIDTINTDILEFKNKENNDVATLQQTINDNKADFDNIKMRYSGTEIVVSELTDDLSQLKISTDSNTEDIEAQLLQIEQLQTELGLAISKENTDVANLGVQIGTANHNIGVINNATIPDI